MLLVFKAFLAPLLLNIFLLVLRLKSWKTWILLSSVTFAWTMSMLMFVDWALISHYLRIGLSLLMPTAIVYSAWKNRGMPWSRKDSSLFAAFGQSLLLVLGVLSVLAVLFRIPAIYWNKPPTEAAVQIDFPLKGGIYSVSHGGYSTTINYHYAYPYQTYAIDIVKLNAWGMRNKPFSKPQKPEDYKIYGEPVYSPVDGKVVKTVDSMNDDLKDLLSLKKSGTSNMVVIAHQDVYILLLHLQKGSIRVKEGDTVKKGQWIANVGNSGYSSEPHLHMHAVKILNESNEVFSGSPVPLLVNGVSLKRNDLILNGKIIFR